FGVARDEHAPRSGSLDNARVSDTASHDNDSIQTLRLCRQAVQSCEINAMLATGNSESEVHTAPTVHCQEVEIRLCTGTFNLIGEQPVEGRGLAWEQVFLTFTSAPERPGG